MSSHVSGPVGSTRRAKWLQLLLRERRRVDERFGLSVAGRHHDGWIGTCRVGQLLDQRFDLLDAVEKVRLRRGAHDRSLRQRGKFMLLLEMGGSVRGDEERVIVAFCAWLEQTGWANIRREVEHVDIVAGRDGQTLCVEAKGGRPALGLTSTPCRDSSLGACSTPRHKDDTPSKSPPQRCRQPSGFPTGSGSACRSKWTPST